MAFRPYKSKPELSLEERVRQLLEKWRPVYNAQANDSIIVGATRALNADDGGWQALRDLINDLIAKNKLVRSPAVQAALDEAKSAHPSYNLNFEAIENRILEKALELKWDITDPKDLTDVASWLIYQSGEGVPLSTLGESQRREQAQEQQRKELIERITLGRDEFVLPQSAQKLFIDADYGKSINVPSARIQGESLERLKELATHVDAYRRARDGGIEKPTITQSDSLGELSSKSERITDNTQVQVINKATGKEFTRAELFHLAKHDVAGFRRVAFPQGSPAYRKAIAEKVNQILGGE